VSRADARSYAIIRWSAFTAWILLAGIIGPAFRGAVDSWNDAAELTFEISAWCIWAVGVVAFVVGRTRSITALRVAAPLAAAVGIAVGVLAEPIGPRVLAIVGSVIVAAFVLSGPSSRALAQGDAYGDEVRVPLRVPPALLLAPIPAALAIMGITFVVAPTLIANGRVIVGIIAVVVGLPVSVFALRSIDGTAARVAVFVPAGLTVVDGFTLAAPLHVPRGDVVSLHRHRDDAPRDDDTTADLRVGAAGGIVVALAAPTSVVVRRGRAAAESVTIDRFAISPVTPTSFIDVARLRGVGGIQDAIAPPSNSSPS